MRRIQYRHYGGPEELRLDEVTTPDAGQGAPNGKLVIIPTR